MKARVLPSELVLWPLLTPNSNDDDDDDEDDIDDKDTTQQWPFIYICQEWYLDPLKHRHRLFKMRNRVQTSLLWTQYTDQLS